MAKGVLIHVRVPADVLKEIDDLGTGETRGAVITEALREYVHRLKQLQAVRTGRGLLAKDPLPYWQSAEHVDGWVRSVRAGWDSEE